MSDLQGDLHSLAGLALNLHVCQKSLLSLNDIVEQFLVQVNRTVDKYCVCSATFWIPLINYIQTKALTQPEFCSHTNQKSW